MYGITCGVSCSLWYRYHILYVVYVTYDMWYRLDSRYQLGYSIGHTLDLVCHLLYMRVAILYIIPYMYYIIQIVYNMS